MNAAGLVKGSCKILFCVGILWVLSIPLFAHGVDELTEIQPVQPSTNPEVLLALPDLTLVNISDATDQSRVLRFQDTGIQADISNLLDDPSGNSGCQEINKVFRNPCKIEAKIQGDNTVDIKLKAGEHEIGEAQAQIVDLAEFPELGNLVTETGYRYAWAAHIKVAQGLTGLGIGKYIFQQVDKAIAVAVNTRQLTNVRIFIDGSTVGWGPSLMKTVNPIWENGYGIWIYILP